MMKQEILPVLRMHEEESHRLFMNPVDVDQRSFIREERKKAIPMMPTGIY